MTSHIGLSGLCILRPLPHQEDMPEDIDQIMTDIQHIGPEGGRVHPQVEVAVERACGSGRPLDSALRDKMNTALEFDFSDVRIHTDSDADTLCRLLWAQAFTTGRDIFFRQGAYAPATMRGLELIAHELVHVMQQHRGRIRSGSDCIIVRPHKDPLEAEADLKARRAAEAAFAGSVEAAENDPQSGFAGCAHWRIVRNTGKSSTSRLQDVCSRRPGLRTGVIQRQLNRFIRAARNELNPLTSESANLRPMNCHEAVIGWLLTALEYPRRWRLIRKAASRHPELSALPTPQFNSTWMWDNFYTGFTQRVNFHNINLLTHRGDILVVGIGAAHSMVVIDNPQPIAGIVHPVPAGTQTHRVNIRGYNNIGSFSQLLGSATGYPPYTPGYIPVPGFPPMQYDNINRDAADRRLWFGPALDRFGPAQSPLFVVRFNDAIANIAQLFPWENSAYMPTRHGERWHFNRIQGWRWA